MAERYPLSDWLDGQIWELEAGADFTETIPNFRSGLRHWAKAHGARLRTSVMRRIDRSGETPEIMVVGLVVQALYDN